MKIYDLIIIGAGPAGLTASIYASRYRIPHLIIASQVGGLASTAHRIGNFPSYKEVSGLDLMSKIENQAKDLGGKILLDEVLKIQKDSHFTLFTKTGEKFKSKTILLALGTKRRKLGLKNEDRFLGKGISYCATCDGPFYKDKVVAVAGGGDAANTASLMLSEIAKKVYQIFLERELHGERIWIEQILKNRKIKIIPNNSINSLEGKEKLEKITLAKPFTSKGDQEISVNGLFVEIGSLPETTLSRQLALNLNKSGYIVTNLDQSTNIKGVWAAGDITTSSNEFRQILTACSEGAVAAESIFKFLKNSLA
jgi:thioredoxin reductase (NADPH)